MPTAACALRCGTCTMPTATCALRCDTFAGWHALALGNASQSLGDAASDSRGGGGSSDHVSGNGDRISSGGGGDDDSDEGTAVAAVAFSPLLPPLVYAAAGRNAYCIDTRMRGTGGGGGDAGSAFAPGGAAGPQSVVARFEGYCTDDIGGLAVHAKGGYLALADDAGVVQV
eukprot:360491-Chlamydomonas_euryale.AAC.1